MILHIIFLSLSTVIWGFGFIATRWAFDAFDPYWTNALRFLFAGLLGLPFLLYKKSFSRIESNIVRKTILSSIFLFSSLFFQTIGLKTTTVAKSGFITTLYSLFIPLIMMVITKKKYRTTFWWLLLMALFGMALMCNLEMKDLNTGDLLTLLSALGAALHIVYIGKIANEISSAIEFNCLQNFFVGIFSVSIAFLIKGGVDFSPLLNFKTQAFFGLFFLVVFSSIIAFSIQLVAQQKIQTHLAGVIFLMEAPFAAFFGHLIFREPLTPMNILGGVLIMLAVILMPILGREVSTDPSLI